MPPSHSISTSWYGNSLDTRALFSEWCFLWISDMLSRHLTLLNLAGVGTDGARAYRISTHKKGRKSFKCYAEGEGDYFFSALCPPGSRCVGLVSRSWVCLSMAGLWISNRSMGRSRGLSLVSFSGRNSLPLLLWWRNTPLSTLRPVHTPSTQFCHVHAVTVCVTPALLCATPLVSAVKARGSAVQLAETWIWAELLSTGSMQECSSPALIWTGCDGWSQTCVCTVAWHNAPASAFEPEVWSSKL